MRNIKEIRAELAALRESYDAKEQELRDEIESVRNARGFVSTKWIDPTPFYEEGRSAARNHNGATY